MFLLCRKSLLIVLFLHKILKMLRLIVGYVKLQEDSWADMFRRLKQKLATLKNHCLVIDWPEALSTRKQKLCDDLQNSKRSQLAIDIHRWDPMTVNDEKLATAPFRGRGRPRTTWQRALAQQEASTVR